jgi:hypothetical protein
MNYTNTSEPPNTVIIVICSTFPVFMLLCICCIIVCTAELRKPAVRATIVHPVIIEAQVIDVKIVPPLPHI